MTKAKFDSEIKTLEKFFSKHCQDKHHNQYSKSYDLEYKKSKHKLKANLCCACHKMISYSFEKLKECKHEEKPRCRKCSTPCYEKTQWKNLAKIMRYSSIELNIEKIKKKLSNFLIINK